MSIDNVPLSALLPPKGNPRTKLDEASLRGLADSIRADGVLQCLVVCPEKRGRFRVIAGGRRLQALTLLREEGAIPKGYPVPAEIREDLSEADAQRISAVENVQREPLDPIDEAEAFLRLLETGATLEDVSVKTGIATTTVRRRLALAALCPEAKAAVRGGLVSLGVAEALTVGSHDRQRTVLAHMEEGYEPHPEEIRHMLLEEKPSVAMAIFPRELYAGSCTSDLFGEAETTYFDDFEQFYALQKAAVERLAEEHRSKAAWVELTGEAAPAWWQYRDAEEGEPAGVVVNLAPNGRVDLRERLARRSIEPQTVAAAKPRERTSAPRPEYAADTVAYIGAHKTLAVQAALLANLRKAKELAVVQLLAWQSAGSHIRIEPHPALAFFERSGDRPRALDVLEAHVVALPEPFGSSSDERDAKTGEGEGAKLRLRLLSGYADPRAVYTTVGQLSEPELDALLVQVLVPCFGQDSLQVIGDCEGVFAAVARDLRVEMRSYWRPDEAFLSGLRREQLEAIAIESGASVSLGRLVTYKKSELVRTLVKYFERTSDPMAELDEHDGKGRSWLPRVMQFFEEDLKLEPISA